MPSMSTLLQTWSSPSRRPWGSPMTPQECEERHMPSEI
jgi:hypothetical protein